MIFLIVLFCLIAVDLAAPSLAAQEVDFNRDIRPILSENCSFCHGPDEATREAGLRLDRQDGAASVVEPLSRHDSELYQRLVTDDLDLRMPPPESNRTMTPEQIELLGRWIDQGAAWEKHWSFRTIEPPPVPVSEPTQQSSPETQSNLGDRVDLQNPIDAFVQQRLQQRGFKASPVADRATLIRRLSLDLIGLPPTPAETEAFVSDDRPDAYRRLVDRLLASPAYGQRMAWDWLDAARYADTNGYQGDRERTMWPWRDWVVQAFNENMPYDQFTIWQLAGDLLPNPSDEQILATGFSRNHMINGEGGRIPEENRVEYVMDMTETMGTVWLGLTLNCCRCHDHKYDPIENEEYYQLFAYFNQTPVSGGGGNPQTPPNLAVPTAQQQRQLEKLNSQIKQLDEKIKLRKASLQQPEQTASQSAGSDAAEEQDTSQPSDSELKLLQEQRESLVESRDAIGKQIPKVMVMADRDETRQTFVLTRGLYNQPTDPVEPGLPDFLVGENVSTTAKPTNEKPANVKSANAGKPSNRLDLARWLVDADNPLTARVTVNRFWQQLFGVGLVKTVEDFGAQGETPEHLQLLNYLAARFVDSGWDVKDLLRLIVTSHTYRQSSSFQQTAAQQVDPENRLLWRGARYRLPSWMLRDQALAASGLLSPVMGGPSVNTYQPEGVWEEASFGKKKYQLDQGEELYRRSLYVFWRRIVKPTMFFDSASRQTCTVNITRTNTPLHALQTLNSTSFVEAARVMASKVLESKSQTDRQRIDRIMRRWLARDASDREAEILLRGLNRSRRQFAEQPEQAKRFLQIGQQRTDRSIDPAEHAAWASLALAVANLDETLNRE